MKYHPICLLSPEEKEIFVKEIMDFAFSNFEEGQKFNIGEIIGCILKSMDFLLMRQLKE